MAPGWAQPTPVTFARLTARRGALCDIPDLELLPARYPDVRTVQFRAALEVGTAQRAFALLAWLLQQGLLRRPERLAPLLNLLGGTFDAFGSGLGGMVCA